MRNPTDGIALAAIVAKETTNGEWSGTGGGIGLGTGGMGFFVGGMSGTRSDQTQRAKEFKGPQEKGYSFFNVHGPALRIIAFGVLCGLFAKGALIMGEGVPETNNSANGPIPDASALFSGFLEFVATFVPLLACLIVAIWFVFFSSGRHKAEVDRVKREEAKINIKKKIYYRLRYVENDHIVFDPESSEEVPAEPEAIAALITRLANQSSEKPV